MGRQYDDAEFAISGDTDAPAQAGAVFSYATDQQSFWRRNLIRAVERISGRATFERLYRDWRLRPRVPGETVFSSAIRALRVRPDLAEGALDLIPQTGPLLVIANHPFGIIDGLLIGHLVSQQRADIKLMCHALLCQPPEARDILLPVDFGTGSEARRRSAETRRQAVDWLDQGHVLIIFPAGGVSTTQTPLARQAVDPDWHPFVLRLARRAGVRTVAMFVHGQNSRLFQVASALSYPLRVALIFHETRRRIGGSVKVSIAPPCAMASVGKTDVVAALRARTYSMAGPGGPRSDQVYRFPRHIRF